MPRHAAPSPPTSPRAAFGWAAYLGCSWTWCIGMFLPILLMRDFGVWAFPVFAIPNVLGAAAMGWILRSAQAADDIRVRHRLAIRTFSYVTIAFHFFWLGWVLSLVAPDGLGAWPHLGDNNILVFPIALSAGVLIIGLLTLRGRLALASTIMWTLSLGLGALVLSLGALDAAEADPAGLFRTAADPGLAFLAPVCLFGFALCPYLDATFIHARTKVDQRASRIAFGVGFGVVFLSMILLTAGYSVLLEACIRVGGSPRMPARVSMALVPHFFLQTVFTVCVHTRAVGGLPRPRALLPLLWLALLFLGFGASSRWYHHMNLGEVVYRCFMSCYALLFPGYVWLCMIPTRDGHSGILGPRGRRKLVTLGAALLLAAPLFWLAAIERIDWCYAPGLAIVVLARLLVRGRPAPAPGVPGDFIRAGA